MTTERVAVRVSDAEMTRRWDAVRKLMKRARHPGADRLSHRGLARRPRALVHRHSDPQRLRPDRGVPRRRPDDGGRAGHVRRAPRDWPARTPITAASARCVYTSFFSSVRLHHRLSGRNRPRGHQEARLQDHRLRGARHHAAQAGARRSPKASTGSKVIDITDADRPADRDQERRRNWSCCAAAREMQDAVFDKVIKDIKPGMRDVDVTAMAYGDGWTQGSSQGIYLGGSAPLGKPSFLMGRHFQDRTLQKGDHLTFLVEVNGPGGYFTEVGRTIVLGKASQELKDNFAATDRGAGLFGEPAQARRVCREIAKAHDDFMKSQGPAAGTAALQPRPGLRHGRAAAGPRRRADVDRARHVPRGASGLRDAEPVRDGLRQLHRRRGNGTDRIHKTERKMFEV